MTERILNDRYALESKVGEGGMAVTYRARDLLLNRTVAIKLMREQFTTDPKFVERFRHEAQAAARLSNENIASVYDTGTANGTHFIVMEFVEGTDLKQRLRANGPLPVLTVLELGRQIASALEAAHEKGLVHRDIKPHNILLNREGKVKVTDFGIAKVVSDSEDTGVIIGSVHYLSPEQARGEATAPACDIYALGCVLFEMLTARTVFEGENSMAVAHKQIYEQPPQVRSLRPDTPPALEALVQRCLEKEPKARFQSASEVKAALSQLAQQLAQEETVVISMPPASDSTIVYRKPLNAVHEKPYQPPTTPATREEVEPVRNGGAGGWIIAIVFVILAAAVTYGVFSVLGNGQKKKVDPGPPSPTKITVPDLSGQTEADAKQAVQALKLRADVAYRFDQNVAAGFVCQQEPAAGTEIGENQTVHLWVSQGKLVFEMPPVVQMTLDKAKEEIRTAAGDDLTKPKLQFIVKSQDSADIPAGQVISTDPPAGTQIDRKSYKITLFVSKGQTAPVENITETYHPGNAPEAYPGAQQVYVKIELENPQGVEPVVLDARMFDVGQAIPDQTFQRKPSDTAVIHMYVGKDENSELQEQDTQTYSGRASTPT